ncbi:MAG TPA: hypothetical protein VGD50_02315, partial [Candidatus Baltobacteraceae bacterium]
TATLSPYTAHALAVTQGDVVDLSTEDRSLADLFISVSAAVADGTVTIVDGIIDAPANLFLPGEVVSVTNIRSAYHELAGAKA